MAFDIEVGGMVPATMKHRLAQIVGDDAVSERGGLDIGRIERT